MENKKDDSVLRLLKKLSLTASVRADQIFAENDLTSAQSEVLKFLLDQEGKKVIFSGDIHMELGISKAAVSMLLKKLRQKGYIDLQSVSGDDRMKQILLTPRACQVKEELDKKMDIFQKYLYQGFSESEYEQLGQLVGRMLANLKSGEETAGQGQKNIEEVIL
nr:MarR family transcriptional regulator [uncultured Eisenbergiella sp.]